MYATRGEFKTWINDTNANDFLVDSCLLAASRYIDQTCGRRFVAETAASKDCWAKDIWSLDLPDDIRTVTSCLVDANGNGTFTRTMTEGTNYVLEPLVPFPDAGIYNRMRVLPYSSSGFAPGYRVRILGNWGYVVNGRAPDDVHTVCLIQASRLYTRRNAPLGILQTVDLGQFTRISKVDPDLQAMLSSYIVKQKGWAVV